MPTAVSGPAVAPNALVDSSVAVPLVVADHDDHRAVGDAVGSRVLGLAGHAAFETYSVLTRLPPPARRGPAAVAWLLQQNFPATRFLSGDAAAELFARLASVGIDGGAVYDALVGPPPCSTGCPCRHETGGRWTRTDVWR